MRMPLVTSNHNHGINRMNVVVYPLRRWLRYGWGNGISSTLYLQWIRCLPVKLLNILIREPKIMPNGLDQLALLRMEFGVRFGDPNQMGHQFHAGILTLIFRRLNIKWSKVAGSKLRSNRFFVGGWYILIIKGG